MIDRKMNPSVRAAPWRYRTPAILLHWVLAFLILGLVVIGWYMMYIEEDPKSAWFFDKHKSFGMIVFALVVIRILWRAGHQPAPLPESVPKWQVRLAHATQWGLYVSIFLMPVLGFFGASYSKDGVTFFGSQLPAWIAPNHDKSELFFSLHIALAWLMILLIALHVAGALKHLLVDRDGVFHRMWLS